MMTDDTTIETRRLAPHQLGWLRRPELDTDTANVWERPDGALVAVSKHSPLVLEHMVSPNAEQWRALRATGRTIIDYEPSPRHPPPATDDQR